jgi:hypothetical protein
MRHRAIVFVFVADGYCGFSSLLIDERELSNPCTRLLAGKDHDAGEAAGVRGLAGGCGMVSTKGGDGIAR